MRISFPTQINLFLGAGILCLAFIGFTSYFSVADFADAARLGTYTQEILANIQEVESIGQDLESSYRGFLLTGNEEEMQALRELQGKLFREVFHLRALTVDNLRQRERLDALERALGDELGALETAAALRLAQGVEAAAKVYPESNRLGRNTALLLGDIRAEENRLLAERRAAIQARQQGVTELIVAGSVTAMVLVGWSVVVINRYRRQRARAEGQLAESEARYRILATEVPVGIFETDASGMCLFVNRRWCEISGRTPEEAGGEGWVTAVHPQDRDRVFDGWQRTARAGEAFEMEFRFLRPDGAVAWVLGRAVAVRQPSGKLRGFLGNVQDITGRKRAEEEVARARERLELSLEGSSLALWDADVPSGRVYLDGRWSEMLGGPRRETVTTVRELARQGHPEERKKLLKLAFDAVAGRIPEYHVEHRVRARNAEWRWILSHGKVVERDSSGKALRMTGTTADITERRAVERMKSEFVSVVSHELRTPLTSIVGALALVHGGAAGEMPPEAKPLLDIAVRNAERLTLLVNDILDLEKIEAGMMRFQPRELDLGGLVRESLEANRTYALKFGVSFELEPLPAGIAVSADPDRLMQVMANLLSNAAKFSPPGGRVEISLSRSGNWARVSVQDHGPGMSEAFQKRVFQRFAQEDTTDAGRKGGTGLGLAICKAIIERSGGRIGFDSRPGGGTSFWFELPAASA